MDKGLFNWLIPTLRFNLKYFPLRQALKLPVYVFNARFLSLKGKVSLPESGIYRGMVKIGYPDKSEEMQLLSGNFGKAVKLEPVMTLDDIASLREQASAVRVNDSVKRYAAFRCAMLMAAIVMPKKISTP